MSFLSILKNIYFNLLKVKSRFLYGRPVLVLMYHRVNDDIGQKLQGLTVDIKSFENQLIYFKKKFQVLSLDEEWKSLKKTGIVITFDDGYADNLINALPLLEKYEIQATIFVSTLNINTGKEFWWDRIVYDYHSVNESFFLPGLKEKVSKEKYPYSYCTEIVSKLEEKERQEWFLLFESLNDINYKSREAYRSLTYDELKKLSEHPLISIGLHTHHHYELGKLSYEEQKKELLLSVDYLNKIVEKSIKYLAVPYGSYNEDTKLLSEELGLKGILLANDYYSSYENKKTRKINRILMPNIRDKEMYRRLRKFDISIL